MKPAIEMKLREQFGSGEPLTEARIVYILVEVRKLLELQVAAIRDWLDPSRVASLLVTEVRSIGPSTCTTAPSRLRNKGVTEPRRLWQSEGLAP